MSSTIVFLAVFGGVFVKLDPNEFYGDAFGQPEPGFILGFDSYGRDSLSRFLLGGRYALFISVVAYVIGGAIGLIIGLLSAYSRGKLDSLLSWFSEILIGFPSIVLMLIIVGALGSDTWVLILALSAVNIPRIFRLVRAAAQSVRDESFIEIAEARGERRIFIMFREILPSVRPSFLVDAGVRIPASILLIASMSFLGLGIQPPDSDWGLIISENRIALTINPLTIMAPILGIAILMIGVNLTFDGLQKLRPSIVRAETK